MIQPKTNYAQNGDVNIAYQVIGDGPLDLLFLPPFVSHLDLYWATPETAAFFSRLASFSRLILFDKRGTGLSDPVSGAATLEERMEDVRAVLDACGSQRTAIFGLSEGGTDEPAVRRDLPGAHDGADHVRLVCQVAAGSQYFWETHESVEEFRAPWIDALENHWGEGKALAMFMPSLGSGVNAQRMLGMFERAAASPAMVLALDQFNTEVDVTQILPVIGVPTLVLHRTDDAGPSRARALCRRTRAGSKLRRAGGERPHAVGRRQRCRAR